jgi:chorismate mutase
MTDQLVVYREQIDRLDEEIVRLLGERFEVCRLVARHKATSGIPMMQPERVSEVKRRCSAIGSKCGLRPDFVEALFAMIIAESCSLETSLMQKGDGDHRAPAPRPEC